MVRIVISITAVVVLGVSGTACHGEDCDGGCLCITTPAACGGSCVRGFIQKNDGTMMFVCENVDSFGSDSGSGATDANGDAKDGMACTGGESSMICDVDQGD